MNTDIIGRRARRVLGVVLVASAAAIGLTACQTGAAPAAPAPISVTAPRPLDRMLIENYGGRPVDRVAEEIERAVQGGHLPSSDCIGHHVVEHPEGGYHFVCLQARD